MPVFHSMCTYLISVTHGIGLVWCTVVSVHLFKVDARMCLQVGNRYGPMRYWLEDNICSFVMVRVSAEYRVTSPNL